MLDPRFRRRQAMPPGYVRRRRRSAAAVPRVPAGVIPPRLNLDLFQVGIAGEAANALGGERIPGAAEGIDDGIVGVEQAVAQVALSQEQPEPLDRVELRRIWRQPDERDVARDYEPLGVSGIPCASGRLNDTVRPGLW